MARSTANTRKVAAAKRKTEEHKEKSKEVNYDDEYRVLIGRLLRLPLRLILIRSVTDGEVIIIKIDFL